MYNCIGSVYVYIYIFRDRFTTYMLKGEDVPCMLYQLTSAKAVEDRGSYLMAARDLDSHASG